MNKDKIFKTICNSKQSSSIHRKVYISFIIGFQSGKICAQIMVLPEGFTLSYLLTLQVVVHKITLTVNAYEEITYIYSLFNSYLIQLKE